MSEQKQLLEAGQKWQADECPDADGFITLRPADGSPNGNTDEQPIATVYDQRHAAFIVRAVNAHDDLIAFVLNVCTAGERIGQQWGGVTMSNQARELAYRLKLETSPSGGESRSK